VNRCAGAAWLHALGRQKAVDLSHRGGHAFLHAHRDDCSRAWAVGKTVVISIRVPPDSSCKLTRVFVTGISGLGLPSASAKPSMNSR